MKIKIPTRRVAPTAPTCACVCRGASPNEFFPSLIERRRDNVDGVAACPLAAAVDVLTGGAAAIDVRFGCMKLWFALRAS